MPRNLRSPAERLEMLPNTALSVRDQLAAGDFPDDGMRDFAVSLIDKIEGEPADDMPGVRDAAERLRLRDDVNVHAMLAYAEGLLRSYDEAADLAAAVIRKAVG